jgi:hypothetical protein
LTLDQHRSWFGVLDNAISKWVYTKPKDLTRAFKAAVKTRFSSVQNDEDKLVLMGVLANTQASAATRARSGVTVRARLASPKNNREHEDESMD